jgi:adenosine deaminase
MKSPERLMSLICCGICEAVYITGLRGAFGRPKRFEILLSPILEKSVMKICKFVRYACVLSVASMMACAAIAQTKAAPASGTGKNLEALAEANLKTARQNPLQLQHFLRGMPKGGDLHNHLSGAVYAESWIRAAAEDHLCVDVAKLAFAKPQGDSCADGKLPAAKAFGDQELYDALIDAFSMRSFVPSMGVSAHDHFFDAFAKFGGTDKKHLGEWIDEVATRAAAQNEQYFELMHTPEFSHAAALATQLGWRDDFDQMRKDLLDRGLRDEVPTASAQLDQAEALRRKREHCDDAGATAACSVKVRFLCQVLRGLPKQIVFAQTVLCFETAAVDPRFVGINYVMPEDGYTSMTDYETHMRVVAFLHSLYPKTHVSLHAGELGPGLVPYEGLCCHIRLAVEQAQAERIGHGVDVMYETKPHELMKEMARNHVMVEISLSSNDWILGVSGKDHPFPLYRMFGVPVALATDDEGVSRIDMTHEYVRAVQTYDLHYADLKKMARTSLEHSFLPGASLWSARDDFGKVATACAGSTLGAEKPSAKCGEFLKANERAEWQWELERRLRAFEEGL